MYQWRRLRVASRGQLISSVYKARIKVNKMIINWIDVWKKKTASLLQVQTAKIILVLD